MPRTLATIGCAVAALALMAGCTVPADPEPTTAPTAPQGTAEPTASATPDPEPEPEPEFVPDGSADDNAPFARFVVQQRADAGDGTIASADVAAALTEAGFAAESLEVTADRTPLGLPVDVIAFAVRVGEACILGEVRGGAVTATTAPVLETGRCLVGADASIG